MHTTMADVREFMTDEPNRRQRFFVVGAGLVPARMAGDHKGRPYTPRHCRRKLNGPGQALAAGVSSGIIVPHKRMPIVVNAERVML